jgi:hypothetical protein
VALTDQATATDLLGAIAFLLAKRSTAAVLVQVEVAVLVAAVVAVYWVQVLPLLAVFLVALRVPMVWMPSYQLKLVAAVVVEAAIITLHRLYLVVVVAVVVVQVAPLLAAVVSLVVLVGQDQLVVALMEQHLLEAAAGLAEAQRVLVHVEK